MAKADSGDVAKVVKGAGALLQALDTIGAASEDDDGDRLMAKIICDNELDLRELVRYALDSITEEL
jgi:hypothetical protein